MKITITGTYLELAGELLRWGIRASPAQYAALDQALCTQQCELVYYILLTMLSERKNYHIHPIGTKAVRVVINNRIINNSMIEFRHEGSKLVVVYIQPFA